MARKAEKNADHRETNRQVLALEAALLYWLLRGTRDKSPQRTLYDALLEHKQRTRVVARQRVAAHLGAETSGRKPPMRTIVRRIDMGDGTYKEIISTHPVTFSPVTKAEKARLRALSRDVVADAKKKETAAAQNVNARAARAQARVALEARLRTVAATETFDTFAQEQQIVAEAFAAVTGAVVEKEWSAVLDLRTCEACAEMDQIRLPLLVPFDNGEPPVHPRCRCVILYEQVR